LIEGQPNRHHPAGVDIAFWPVAPDIAAQANIGFRGADRALVPKACSVRRAIILNVGEPSHVVEIKGMKGY